MSGADQVAVFGCGETEWVRTSDGPCRGAETSTNSEILPVWTAWASSRLWKGFFGFGILLSKMNSALCQRQSGPFTAGANLKFRLSTWEISLMAWTKFCLSAKNHKIWLFKMTLPQYSIFQVALGSVGFWRILLSGMVGDGECGIEESIRGIVDRRSMEEWMWDAGGIDEQESKRDVPAPEEPLWSLAGMTLFCVSTVFQCNNRVKVTAQL